MRKMKRNLLAFVLAVAGVATTVVGANAINASADGEVVTEKYFRMIDGASIREITAQGGDLDQNGIRFATELSEAFYNAIEKKENESVQFYTLVSNEAKSVESLTYAENTKKVAWGEIDFDVKGTYVRYTELMNFSKEFYATTFTARSCYVLDNATPDNAEDDTIVYATGTESYRSMEGVAIAHLTQNPNEMADFGKYVGLSESAKFASDVRAYGFEKTVQTAQTFDVESVETLGSPARVYAGARLVKGATVDTQGNVTLPADEIKGFTEEARVYSVADGTAVYQKTVKKCDFVIDSPTTLEAFAKGVAVGTRKTAILMANVDASTITWPTVKFTGELDGNGYTIANITASTAGMFHTISGATVKNIAFVNVTQTRDNNGGLFAWNADNTNGTNYVKNVYVQGTLPNATGTNIAGLGWIISSIGVTNTIMEVEFKTVDKYGALGGRDNNGNTFYGENTFAISNTAKGFMIGTAGYSESAGNYGKFNSYADFKAELAKEDSKYSVESFDKAYWEKINGVIVFKSAKDFLFHKEVKISCGNATVNNELTAGTYTIDTAPNATLSIETEVDGVELNGNELTIEDTVSANTTITINASYTDPSFGYTCTGTKTFTVIENIETVAIQGTQIHGINRGYFELDLSTYNFMQDDVKAVAVDGKTQTATLANGILKVSVKVGDVTAGNTVSASISIKNYLFTASVKTVHFAIGTTAELDDLRILAFQKSSSFASNTQYLSAGCAYKTYTSAPFTVTADNTVSTYLYVELLSNIDASKLSSSYVNAYFHGEFEGNGYTVSGWPISTNNRSSLFWGLKSARVKNVAFVGLESTRTDGQGSLLYWNATGVNTLENVYVQGTAKKCGAGLTNSLTNSVLKNVIVNIQATTTDSVFAISNSDKTHNAFGADSDNVYAISSSVTKFTVNPVSLTNYGLFADVNALAKSGKNFSSFNNAYWTMQKVTIEGTEYSYPVWKNLPQA